jgi:hypothetical protein
MSSYDHWKTTQPEWLDPDPEPAADELDELDRLQQLKDCLASMRVQEQAEPGPGTHRAPLQETSKT